jgi:predicted MFS family arabinose efflux permease
VVQFTVVFGEEVFDAGPRVVGVLASAIGLGAVCAAPFLSSWDGRLPRSSVIRWVLPLYGLSVLSFALSPNWGLGLVALLGVGGGFLSLVATTNTAVQMIVTDAMRGRVMSIRIMGFTASYPIGVLLQGAMADVVGPRATVATAGLVIIVVGLLLASRPVLLRSLDREDDTPDRPVGAPSTAGSPAGGSPAGGLQ